jgi:hypothetical protein
MTGELDPRAVERFFAAVESHLGTVTAVVNNAATARYRPLNLRCGETAGTDFASREMETGRALDADQQWFRMNLRRHTGLMQPHDVAEAVVALVTLPRGHQYSFMEVMPTAPIGALPTTFEEWGLGVAERLAPQ